MKKVLGVFLTDTHLGEGNVAKVISIFRQAIQQAKELGLKVIFHKGDIFHSRKGQTQELLSVFDDILDEIKEAGLTLIAIPGNHDKSDYGSWKSFLKSFRHHPSFDLIQHHVRIALSKDVYLTMIPFFEDEQYLKELGEAKKHLAKGNGVKNVCATHIGIQGAVMNSGITVESSITPNHFKEFDLTMVGHYHDEQSLAGGLIRYVGASGQHDFGENEKKGLTLLYDDLTLETVSLDFPRFRTFSIDAKDVTTKDIAGLKEEKDRTGDHIRVILTGEGADVKAFNKKLLSEIGIKVETKETPIDREELQHRVVPFNDKSLREEFDVFCDKEKMEDVPTGINYFNKAIAV